MHYFLVKLQANSNNLVRNISYFMRLRTQTRVFLEEITVNHFMKKLSAIVISGIILYIISFERNICGQVYMEALEANWLIFNSFCIEDMPLFFPGVHIYTCTHVRVYSLMVLLVKLVKSFPRVFRVLKFIYINFTEKFVNGSLKTTMENI